MTAENVAAFPQPKPTIAEIVHTCVMAGRSARDILTMSREAHPAKPFDAIKAEIVGAFQAKMRRRSAQENSTRSAMPLPGNWTAWRRRRRPSRFSRRSSTWSTGS